MRQPPLAEAQHVAVRVAGRDELPVRLAEVLDEQPRQRVADEEQPEDPPRPRERPGPDRQRQHDEEQPAPRAPPRRAARDAGRRGRPSPAGQACAASPGKTTAQGAVDGRPQSSPLTKLATRPKKMPIGAAAATASPTDRIGSRFFSAEADHPGRDPEQPAVERHAALPDREDLAGFAAK